jgi:hypothetical protein
MPVGAPSGMLTTNGTTCGILPLTPPRYTVETLDPLSATHNGDDALAACPHGFTRFGSVTRATPVFIKPVKNLRICR